MLLKQRIQNRLYFCKGKEVIHGRKIGHQLIGVVSNFPKFIAIFLKSGVFLFDMIDFVLQVGFLFGVVQLSTVDILIIRSIACGKGGGSRTGEKRGTGTKQRSHHDKQCTSDRNRPQHDLVRTAKMSDGTDNLDKHLLCTLHSLNGIFCLPRCFCVLFLNTLFLYPFCESFLFQFRMFQQRPLIGSIAVCFLDFALQFPHHAIWLMLFLILMVVIAKCPQLLCMLQRFSLRL